MDNNRLGTDDQAVSCETDILGLPLGGEAKKDGGLSGPVRVRQVSPDFRVGCKRLSGFFFFALTSVPLIVCSMRFPAGSEALLCASSLRWA